MDNLDAMILRDLTFRPADHQSFARGVRRPWDTARALGLHGTTIKRRMAEMRTSGLLRGVHVQPAPALLGLHAAEYILTYPDTAAKRNALDALRAEPALWEFHGAVGPDIAITINAPLNEDLDLVARRIANETGAASVRFHHRTSWDVQTERVSALDLRILAAFSDNALRPISEAAAEVGVAAKTITARMRALAGLKAFLCHNEVDYTRVTGGMFVLIDMPIEPGHVEQVSIEISNRFPLAVCRSPRHAENGYVVMHVNGAADLEEHVARAESIPGVTSVWSVGMRDVHHAPERWREALLNRAEELARAKGIWSPSWRARLKPTTTTP